MKVAIIGCGLVGMEAALHLKRAGHEVTGTTTRASRVPELETCVDQVAVLSGSDEEKLAQLLVDKDVVIVSVSGGMFAQAGKGTVRDPERYQSIYVDTAETLLRVLAHNTSVQQVIYTSAETVYAGMHQGPIMETTPLPDHSADPPTQVFVKTEQLISAARQLEKKVCIFRLGIVYGRRFSMELMIELAKKGPVPFSGESIFTFVHVRDVGRALAHAIDKGLDGIYNVDASPSYYKALGRVLTNKEFFDTVAAQQTPPFTIQWLGLVKGWADVSNQALLDTGFTFEIITPYAKEPEHADIEEAVRRLCIPMRDAETHRFTHKGCAVEIEMEGGGQYAAHAYFGLPFYQELYVRSSVDETDRLMSHMIGMMQKGADDTKLLMHYYGVKSQDEVAQRALKDGKKVLKMTELGERMYTLELQYDPEHDCYRGEQRYDVKLHHLIGMMPADLVQKIFSKDKKAEQKTTDAPQGMPMPQAEWHLLELYPSHAMYMHAFLANKNDDKPMPMMGMQKPYRFQYLS